jgi:hypothetical protein
MIHPRQSALQRIQVGLIGLVVVLLFVSLANMALERAVDAHNVAIGGGGITGTEIATEAKNTPNAPLSELGVTPVVEATGKGKMDALPQKPVTATQ